MDYETINEQAVLNDRCPSCGWQIGGGCTCSY